MSGSKFKNMYSVRWRVLWASCLINLCIGALYAWSVFSAPLAVRLSEILGRQIVSADLAIVFSVGNSFGFITMIAGGFLDRTIGTRAVIGVGGILFGAGFIVCGLAADTWVPIVGYGVMAGLAMGLVYGCTISNTVKFFPDKAGLAGGLTTASYGISSVILPPLVSCLIQKNGVGKTFIFIGVFIMAAVFLLSRMIVRCPEDFHIEKRGSEGGTALAGASEQKDLSPAGMLSDFRFWCMLVMLFFGACAGMMSISRAADIGVEVMKMSAPSAAVVVSVLALFNTSGRVLAGAISDRIGFLNTVIVVYIAEALGCVCLLSTSGKPLVLFLSGICLTGLSFGAFMGVYPGFISAQFGRTYGNINYGIMFIGFNAAGFFGPLLIGNIVKVTGGYTRAFQTGIVMSLCGLLLSVLLRGMKRKAPGKTG